MDNLRSKIFRDFCEENGFLDLFERKTYLIDKDGKIASVWLGPDLDMGALYKGWVETQIGFEPKWKNLRELVQATLDKNNEISLYSERKQRLDISHFYSYLASLGFEHISYKYLDL